jgi:3D (Asp-Asp-Asp) domain-containing protein
LNAWSPRIVVCLRSLAVMSSRTRKISLSLLIPIVSACAHRVQPAPPQGAPAGSAQVRFVATAYCTKGITASGVPVARGIVAADPDVLPLGTVIRITGAARYDGTYRVLDTGALVQQRHVDLYIPDCAAARQFGRRSVHVTVLRRPH